MKTEGEKCGWGQLPHTLGLLVVVMVVEKKFTVSRDSVTCTYTYTVLISSLQPLPRTHVHIFNDLRETQNQVLA